MQAVDSLFDRCEETVRHTGQPILSGFNLSIPPLWFVYTSDWWVEKPPDIAIGVSGTGSLAFGPLYEADLKSAD